MIIVMKPHASQASINNVTEIVKSKGLQVHLSQGEEVTIIGVVGDKTRLANQNLELAPEVDKIVIIGPIL